MNKYEGETLTIFMGVHGGMQSKRRKMYAPFLRVTEETEPLNQPGAKLMVPLLMCLQKKDEKAISHKNHNSTLIYSTLKSIDFLGEIRSIFVRAVPV